MNMNGWEMAWMQIVGNDWQRYSDISNFICWNEETTQAFKLFSRDNHRWNSHLSRSTVRNNLLRRCFSSISFTVCRMIHNIQKLTHTHTHHYRVSMRCSYWSWKKLWQPWNFNGHKYTGGTKKRNRKRIQLEHVLHSIFGMFARVIHIRLSKRQSSGDSATNCDVFVCNFPI